MKVIIILLFQYYYSITQFDLQEECSATNIPLVDAYQPLHLFGLLQHDSYNQRIITGMDSDLFILVAVIIMRSLLKRNGIWNYSLNYYILQAVRNSILD